MSLCPRMPSLHLLIKNYLLQLILFHLIHIQMLMISLRNLSISMTILSRVNQHIAIAKMNPRKAQQVVQPDKLHLIAHLAIQMTISKRVLTQTRRLTGLVYILMDMRISYQFFFLISCPVFWEFLSCILLCRSFDEPTWGTFDNNDDTDSVWGFSSMNAKVRRPFEIHMWFLVLLSSLYYLLT